MQGISELAEEFITFQEGLCSLKLFSKMQTSYSRADAHPSFLNLYEYHFKNLQIHTVHTSVGRLLCDVFADLRRQLFTSRYSATSNKTYIFCL